MEHIKTPVKMECEGFLVDANGELLASLAVTNRAGKGAAIVLAVNCHEELVSAASKALNYMRMHNYADQAWADDLEAALKKAGAR